MKAAAVRRRAAALCRVASSGSHGPPSPRVNDDLFVAPFPEASPWVNADLIGLPFPEASPRRRDALRNYASGIVSAKAGSGSDREKLAPKVTDEVSPLRMCSFSVRKQKFQPRFCRVPNEMVPPHPALTSHLPLEGKARQRAPGKCELIIVYSEGKALGSK